MVSQLITRPTVVYVSIAKAEEARRTGSADADILEAAVDILSRNSIVWHLPPKKMPKQEKN